MNKKINLLIIIPIYGAIILMIWLFIKMIKEEINKKNFYSIFISSALFGFLSILVIILFLKFINVKFSFLFLLIYWKHKKHNINQKTLFDKN